jgi:hypothetical protein
MLIQEGPHQGKRTVGYPNVNMLVIETTNIIEAKEEHQLRVWISVGQKRVKEIKIVLID